MRIEDPGSILRINCLRDTFPYKKQRPHPDFIHSYFFGTQTHLVLRGNGKSYTEAQIFAADS